MRRIWLHPEIIYGPVRSRRLGISLGLNILPKEYKLCSFDCVYCQYGWTSVCSLNAADRLGDLPTLDRFEEALVIALRQHREIDNITFSGNGEPTLHPQFENLVDIAKQLKEKYSPKAKLGVLSNSSTVSVENVFRALEKLDFRIMKLDTGHIATFREVNRPCDGVDYAAILKGLKSLQNVILQTMFIKEPIQNVGSWELQKWIEKVGEVQPVKVQIYSLNRAPAEPSLQEVPANILIRIAAEAERVTGVTVEVAITS